MIVVVGSSTLSTFFGLVIWAASATLFVFVLPFLSENEERFGCHGLSLLMLARGRLTTPAAHSVVGRLGHPALSTSDV